MFPISGKSLFFPGYTVDLFQSKLCLPRCVSPPPPPPYTWASGVSSSFPGSEVSCSQDRFMRSTSRCPIMPLSPRFGPLFPSGRRARAVPGPPAPIPVAILAAGQRLGGSDVLPRAEEASHVADYEGGSDVTPKGRAILEPTSQSLRMDEKLLPGRFRDAEREVTSGTRLWRNGATPTAPAAEKREWQLKWLHRPTFNIHPCPRGGNPKDPGIRRLGTLGCGVRSWETSGRHGLELRCGPPYR